MAAGFTLKWAYFVQKGLGKEYAAGLRKGLGQAGGMEGPSAGQYLNCMKLQPALLKNVLIQLYGLLEDS